MAVLVLDMLTFSQCHDDIFIMVLLSKVNVHISYV